MDIEKLIEELKNAAGGPEGIKMCHDAATTISALQAENAQLRVELMTREEAIVQIKGLKNYCEDMADSDESGSYVFDLDVQALDLALTALRPVSREQVEKVWRGCEKCNGAGEYSRYAENLTKILLAKYCPHCGRPLTDEAVEMVMERMEALKDAGD